MRRQVCGSLDLSNDSTVVEGIPNPQFTPVAYVTTLAFGGRKVIVL
jgi:hypothetical protein